MFSEYGSYAITYRNIRARRIVAALYIPSTTVGAIGTRSDSSRHQDRRHNFKRKVPEKTGGRRGSLKIRKPKKDRRERERDANEDEEQECRGADTS